MSDMDDVNEAVYIHEPPKGRLAIQLCDLAPEAIVTIIE